jgi:MscS family membrane protein
LISIPNAQVATNPVTINVRSKKVIEVGNEEVQISMDLNLVSNTSAAKIAKAMKIIRDAVNETKGCKKNPEVAFTNFNNIGLGISAVYQVEDVEGVMRIKHNVNLLIKKRFEEEEIKLAYPTTTVYLERGESFA